MIFTFRADASVQIGTGHVMRCLTLARELRNHGHSCTFVCRDLQGHFGERIRAEGFDLTLLPAPMGAFQPEQGEPSHAAWAQVSWTTDAEQTKSVARDSDWLVVDHYAFDARWQTAARPDGGKIAVIDDLADRSHIADLLIDQNFGRVAADYDGLVPDTCERLIGPAYVLMRPEFARLRNESLTRRKNAGLGHILITMGGMDNDDATSQVLAAINENDLPTQCRLSVVMGKNAPYLDKVKRTAETMTNPTEVLVDVKDMAALMAQADLAIGAAGGTSWERSCLGLPSLLLVLADNQTDAADAMESAGVATVLGDVRSDHWRARLTGILGDIQATNSLASLPNGAIENLDGLGCPRCRTALEKEMSG